MITSTEIRLRLEEIRKRLSAQDPFIVRGIHASHLVDCIDDISRQNRRAISIINGLLLSRDSSWTGGHDWQEAVNLAIEFTEGAD